jgi:SAM-dependent methyltransferase
VLNVPAGDGDLTRLLEEAGLRATAADLFPEFSKWKPQEVVRADMNERMPFGDASFDAVVCQEGIEHLENPAGFLRECRRVLREGGVLWLSTPNVMDLSSRFAWFLLGVKSFHGDLPNEEATLWGTDGGREYHGHAFMLPYFQIRYLLRVQHFADVEVVGMGRSGTSRALYLLLRPFLGLLLRRSLRGRSERDRAAGRRAASAQLLAEIARQALSPELLCSRKICVRAVRAGTFLTSNLLAAEALALV